MYLAEIIEILKDIEIHNLIFCVLAMWWFTYHMKRDIMKELADIKQEIHSVNIRTGRLEGTVYGRDFYREAQSGKKAD